MAQLTNEPDSVGNVQPEEGDQEDLLDLYGDPDEQGTEEQTEVANEGDEQGETEPQQQEEQAGEPEPPATEAPKYYKPVAPTPPNLDGIRQILGDEMTNAIVGVVSATMQEQAARQAHFQSQMREAGWNADMMSEYGPELQAVASQLPPDVQMQQGSTNMALAAAIVHRVAQGADMAAEFERAAQLMRGGRPAPVIPPQKRTTTMPVQAPAQRAPQSANQTTRVVTRTDRPSSVTQNVTQPRNSRDVAAEFLKTAFGMDSETAAESTRRARK